jgi:hypothetical protein
MLNFKLSDFKLSALSENMSCFKLSGLQLQLLLLLLLLKLHTCQRIVNVSRDCGAAAAAAAVSAAHLPVQCYACGFELGDSVEGLLAPVGGNEDTRHIHWVAKAAAVTPATAAAAAAVVAMVTAQRVWSRMCHVGPGVSC